MLQTVQLFCMSACTNADSGLAFRHRASHPVSCLQEGLSGQKKNFHWDKRRKRYVQLQPGEQVTAGGHLAKWAL